MNFDEIQEMLNYGRHVPPISDAALRILQCLRTLDYRVGKLEKAANGDNLARLYPAATEYAHRITERIGEPTKVDFWSELSKAFYAGFEFARQERAPRADDKADEKILTEPLDECPCVFCERSRGEHEVFRGGYLAGLRGDDFDTNPHDDEPWNREAWDDGWKLGRAEWERYNPEPDESEGEPCRNRLKEAIPGIDGVYFWCPECHGRLTFGDGKTVVDYETELRKRLGGQVKCEDCGEALEIPMDVQFERVEDPE